MITIGKVHAKEALSRRQPVIPSKHFVNTFMCSFAEDPVFNLLRQDEPTETQEANGGFSKALELLRKKEYEADIISLCTEELNNSDVTLIS